MLVFGIIFLIAIAIGANFYRKTAEKLEAVKEEADDRRGVITAKRVDIFASRKSNGVMVVGTLFIFALFSGLIIYFISEGLIGDIFYGDTEVLFLFLMPTVIFVPILGYFTFLIWRVEKAVRSKMIVMHIDKNGFECHSKMLGKPRQYNWEDVDQFYPATRRQGAVASIVIEFKLSGKHNAEFFQDKVQFYTAAIDQDIVELLKHFENFSGLKAGHLRKTWS